MEKTSGPLPPWLYNKPRSDFTKLQSGKPVSLLGFCTEHQVRVYLQCVGAPLLRPHCKVSIQVCIMTSTHSGERPSPASSLYIPFPFPAQLWLAGWGVWLTPHCSLLSLRATVNKLFCDDPRQASTAKLGKMGLPWSVRGEPYAALSKENKNKPTTPSACKCKNSKQCE